MINIYATEFDGEVKSTLPILNLNRKFMQLMQLEALQSLLAHWFGEKAYVKNQILRQNAPKILNISIYNFCKITYYMC